MMQGSFGWEILSAGLKNLICMCVPTFPDILFSSSLGDVVGRMSPLSLSCPSKMTGLMH